MKSGRELVNEAFDEGMRFVINEIEDVFDTRMPDEVIVTKIAKRIGLLKQVMRFRGDEHGED